MMKFGVTNKKARQISFLYNDFFLQHQQSYFFSHIKKTSTHPSQKNKNIILLSIKLKLTSITTQNINITIIYQNPKIQWTVQCLTLQQFIYFISRMSEQVQKEKPDYRDVQNGPLDQSNRECRDIFCCLLFLVNIVGMIYVTIHAYIDGNPDNIYRGVGRDNNSAIQCGTGAAKNYPYIYFYNPFHTIEDKVCVKECPSYSGNSLSDLQCYKDTTPSTCNYAVIYGKDGSLSSGTLSDNSDVVLGYDSILVLDRVCMPSPNTISQGFKTITSTLSTALQQGQFGTFMADVENNWQWLLAGMGIALVISLIYMFLLRCLVGCIVWVSCIGVILVFIGAGIIFLYNGGAIAGDNAENAAGVLGLPVLEDSEYYNVYGYICLGVAFILLILLLCCCSRIRLAVAVCKVAGRYVIRVCLIILVPIFQTLLLIALWAACLVVMIYLVSLAEFHIAENSDLFTTIKDYADPNLLRFYYFVFATLWVGALLGAIEIFVIASSCAMWYYNNGAEEELDSPILRSYKMAFRYHFGSLAFGAFILAVVRFLMFLVEVFKKQAEASGADQNQCFEYLVNCLQCCLACIERIVQFLNKTAYIQIAIRGKNFCSAAKDGFETVWGNGARYLIVAGIGEIMMFFGKLFIAAGTTACFYALITFVPTIKENIVEPLYLLILTFLVSYIIGALFMEVYNVAVDTILACFIVDEMNQEASGGKKALHAPEELYDLMPDE